MNGGSISRNFSPLSTPSIRYRCSKTVVFNASLDKTTPLCTPVVPPVNTTAAPVFSKNSEGLTSTFLPVFIKVFHPSDSLTKLPLT